MARYILHRFFGQHRGLELAAVRRRDIQLPADLLREEKVMYTRVDRPKNAWAGPLKQHSTVDAERELAFIARYVSCLGEEELIYPFSHSQLLSRWQRLMDALGNNPRLLPLRSLRGGGTVWLWGFVKDLPYVCWQGRWQEVRNVEYYLQEAYSRSIVSGLSQRSKSKLVFLESLYPRMIS